MKKKIFLVIPTLTAGGAERVISELANNWVKNENLIVHIVLLSEGDIFYNIDKRVIIHNFFFPVNLSFFRKSLGIIHLAFKFRKFIKNENPYFVLSFMNKYNIFVLISLIFLKINVFVSERDSPTEIIPKLTEILRNVTYRFAKGIITQTNASKNFLLKEIGNVNVVVIPNPIRPIKIDETIKREKIILNVGRLVEKKGQKYLIEAFSKIDSKGWKLIFLGDGPLKSDLIKLAINNNIINKVIFMGTSKEVDLWLNKSSIFAFPSILEGFPNALAEAMSAGLPCVSFNCETGPSELISNEVNGFLIEVGDVNTLAEKLELLMNNPDIRNIISKNALQVGDMLNSNKISKYYLDFCFNNIL